MFFLRDRAGPCIMMVALCLPVAAQAVTPPLAWSPQPDSLGGRVHPAAGVIGATLYLVGGGTGFPGTSAEMCDTDTGLWYSIPPMSQPESGAAGAVIGTAFLVLGGNDGTGATRSTQVYDTASRTWFTVAPMGTARYDLAATTVGVTVFAIGGRGSPAASGSMEAYDPFTNTWTFMAPLPAPLYGQAAVTLGGLVYAVGGYGSMGATGALSVYDPSTNIWVALATMPTPRSGLAAVVVGGTLYAIGGATTAGTALATVERYDPFTNTWSTDVPLPAPRFGLAAVVADSTTILAIGGATDTAPFVRTVERSIPDAATPTLNCGAGVSPATGLPGTTVFAWSVVYTDLDGDAPAAGLPALHLWQAGTEVPGSPFSMIYAAGAFATGATYNFSTALALAGSNYAWQIQAADWQGAAVSCPGGGPVAGPTVLSVGGGAGGGCPAGPGVSGACLEDLVWSARANMFQPRMSPAVGINGTVIYAAGGYAGLIQASMEAYDTVLNTWSVKAPLPTPRYGAAGAFVSGKFWVIGGRGSGTALSIVESYDPGTNTWSTRTPMPTARYDLSVAVQGTTIYAFGGSGGGMAFQVATEAYDTLTGVWSVLAPMPTGRSQMAAFYDPLGQCIAVVGGLAGGTLPVATAEEYSWVSNSWTCQAPMPTARSGLAAAGNTGIAFIGGRNGTTFFDSVEELLAPCPPAVPVPWGTTVFPMPTRRAGLAIVNDYSVVPSVLYAIGGFNGTYLRTVEKGIHDNYPQLQSTGEPGYIADAYEPQSGMANSTVFTFRISYFDQDDDAPSLGDPRIHIYKGGTEIPGSPLTMTYVMGAFNVGVGAIYTVNTALTYAGSDYTYDFDARDIFGAASIPPGGPCFATEPGPLPGPTVTGPTGQAAGANPLFTCVYPYPNPCDIRKGQRQIKFNGTGVPHGTIRIYALDGSPVKVLEEHAGKFEVGWEVEAEGVAAGSYLWTSENPVEHQRGKVTVIR